MCLYGPYISFEMSGFLTFQPLSVCYTCSVRYILKLCTLPTRSSVYIFQGCNY